MAWEDSEGNSNVARMASRGGGVQTSTMEDGGTVFSGDEVDNLLDKLNGGPGVNAATLADGEILIRKGLLGSDKGKDTYWHEKLHQVKSGSFEAGYHDHAGDAEELGGQVIGRINEIARERFQSVNMPDMVQQVAGRLPTSPEEAEELVTDLLGNHAAAEHRGDDEIAYYGLRAQGYSHVEIIRQLGDYVVKALDEAKSKDQYRRGQVEG